MLLLAPLVSATDRCGFLENGFILKENFLPEEQFLRLAEELRNYEGQVLEFVEDTTLTQRAFMVRDVRQGLPTLKAFAGNPWRDQLMRYYSSKNRPPLFYIENLCNHANVAPWPDPRKIQLIYSD